MKQLPSRHRRLDDALAALPLDEPMLLSELDGFLTGVIVAPEPIPPDEWLAGVWGADDSGIAPFEDPLDVDWFRGVVMARYAEIGRDLARGKPRPIFDVDERNGELLWDYWIDGFDQAMALRAAAWEALIAGDDAETSAAALCLRVLIAVAHDESGLDAAAINALHDSAPDQIDRSILCLYAATSGVAAGLPEAKPPKIGRNDPCRCGSGLKSKRCCG